MEVMEGLEQRPWERRFDFILKNDFTPRMAAQFVQLANQFSCEIAIQEEHLSINGKSVLGMLSLQLPAGKAVGVHIKGKNTVEAEEADRVFLSLKKFFLAS
ncbi:hypothetical protein FACS1894111_06400 [Clostridia bacterium]|nr:hypothetical protein FACS1894111_06400 [Clostridia bacterium]